MTSLGHTQVRPHLQKNFFLYYENQYYGSSMTEARTILPSYAPPCYVAGGIKAHSRSVCTVLTATCSQQPGQAACSQQPGLVSISRWVDKMWYIQWSSGHHQEEWNRHLCRQMDGDRDNWSIRETWEDKHCMCFMLHIWMCNLDLNIRVVHVCVMRINGG